MSATVRSDEKPGRTYRQVFPPGEAARSAVGIESTVEAAECDTLASAPSSEEADGLGTRADEAVEGAARAEEAADEAAEMTASRTGVEGEAAVEAELAVEPGA